MARSSQEAVRDHVPQTETKPTGLNLVLIQGPKGQDETQQEV